MSLALLPILLCSCSNCERLVLRYSYLSTSLTHSQEITLPLTSFWKTENSFFIWLCILTSPYNKLLTFSSDGSFFICKIGIIWVPPLKGSVKIKWDNPHKPFSTVPGTEQVLNEYELTSLITFSLSTYVTSLSISFLFFLPSRKGCPLSVCG